MTIEVTDDILDQTVSRTNIKNYRDFKKSNTKSWDEYRKEIAKTSKEFQDLVTIANDNGIDIDWDNETGQLIKGREELEALNVKYAEGTKAAELYARAQEAEAKATNYSADASVRAAEAKRKEILIERERLLNSTDSRDVLMGLMGYQDLDSNPKDKVIKKNYIDPDSTDSLRVWLAELDKERNKLDQNSVAAGKYSAKKRSLANSQTIVNAKTKIATTSLNMQAGALKIGAAAANLAGKAMRFFGFESAAAMAKALGPTIALTAALWGVQKVIEFISEHAPTLSNLKEQAVESSQAFEEAKGKVESLDSELQTTKDRIEELESAGPLSLTEQSELERLKKQNTELEKQLSIEKAITNEKERKATEDNFDVIEKMNTESANRYGRNGQRVDVDSSRYSKYYDPDMSKLGNDLNIKIEEYKAELAKLENMEVDLNDDKSRKKWEEQKEIVDSYKTTAMEAFEEINTELDETNPDLLDEDQLALYEELVTLRDKLYLSTGDLNMDTAMKSVLGTEQYDVVIAKMQELANSKKEINKDTVGEIFSPTVLAQLENIGIDMDSIIEQIQSMRGISGTIDTAIDNSDNADQVRKNIDEMISDKDFEIDTEAIQKVLGDDIVKACEKAGYSVDDLINHFKRLQEESSKVDFTSAINDIKSIDDAMSTLTDAMGDFAEDSEISSESLYELSDSVLSSLDGFEDFISVITDSSSSFEDVVNAAEQLVDSFFAQQDILGALTEENAYLYEQELKRMGIENSSEIVQHRLAMATLKNADATKQAKSAAEELIGVTTAVASKMDLEALAAVNASNYVDVLRASEELAAGTNFDSVMTSHANSLIMVANAAFGAQSAVAQYLNALKSSGLSSIAGAKSYSQAMYLGKMQDEAKKEMSAITNFFKNMPTVKMPTVSSAAPYKLSGSSGGSSGSSGGGGSGSGGGGKSKADREKEAADKRADNYDKAKKKLDHQLEMNYISYQKYYDRLVALGRKYYKDKKGKVYKKNLEDWRDHLETLAKAREDAYDKAKDNLDKSLEKEKISINTYYKKVAALQKKWLKGRKSNAEKYAEEVEELQNTVFEHYEDELDELKDWIETQNINKTWVPGENELTAFDKFYEKILRAYEEGMMSYEQYYQLRKKAEKELRELELDRYESQKSSLDDLVDLVSDMLRQEKEDMIDALEKQLDKYREICEAKKESLDTTRAELEYQRELKEANEDLTELQAKAAVLKLDTSREGKAKYKALMEEIAQKQQEIADKQDEHAYDATIEGIDKALEKYEEKIEKKIDEINEFLNDQGKWLEYVYDYINNTDPSKLLDQLIEFNSVHGTGIAADVHDIWDRYQEVVGENQGKKIQEIIDLLRQQIKDAENSDSGSSSENYQRIGEMIFKMQKNVEAMNKLDRKDPEQDKEWKRLNRENLALAEKIRDQSSGEFDNITQNNKGEWVMGNGSNVSIFDKISDKGRTAATIKKEMANASYEDQVELAKELRQIYGYKDVFYDSASGKWYKNKADWKENKALFDDEGYGDPQNTNKEILAAIRKNLDANNITAVKKLVEEIRKLSGYGEAFYDSNTKAVYKSALGFYNGVAMAGPDRKKKPTAKEIIKAMVSSNNAATNNALVKYLKKYKGYEQVYYDKKLGYWVKDPKTKKRLSSLVYHKGIDAGFVGDDYRPTPKQNELYALLKKGELVLNQNDQDRLAVQMQVLSSLSDSLKSSGSFNPSNIINNTSGDITLHIDAPLYVQGDTDAKMVKAMNKHGDIIADKALSKLTGALEMRGYSVTSKNNMRKR